LDTNERVVHVFDPGLGPTRGHHLNFDLAIVSEVEHRTGFECVVWGRLDLSADARLRLPVRAFFVKGARWRWEAGRAGHRGDPEAAGAVSRERERRKARQSRAWNEFHRLRLCALAPGVVEPGDVVFFHSFLRWAAAGIAGWLRDPSAAESIAVIFFMFTDYLDSSGGCRAEYEQLFDVLAARSSERTFLIAETREIRDDLVRLSGYRLAIAIAPHITLGATLDVMRKGRLAADPGVGFCVGYAGHNRLDRGSHFIPDVLERVAARAPRAVRFRVHFEDPRSQPGEARRLATMRSVDFRSGRLSEDDFYRFLAGMDIVLLPFEPGPRTHRRGSAMFWESLALGLVMVLPQGSHLEREAGLWGGGFTTYEKWDPEAIVDAALAALESFELLDPLARAAGARWSEARRFSTFMDLVLGPSERASG
jgi:glycosyltransferase involved in cell wall biosynthesis